jgi:hypothetical protein
VLLYETEQIAEAQEGVVESVRQKRKRELEHERIFAKEGEEVLTDMGILIEAHPLNALEDARMARRLYNAVCKLLSGSPETPIEGGDGAWILERAGEQAVRLAAIQSGEEPEREEVRLLSEALLERLPGMPDDAYLEEMNYSAGQLLDPIGWLATEAGVKPEVRTVEGEPVSPQEQLVERLNTEARYELAENQAKAEKAQAQLLATRRARILPSEEDLQKIARYEAHLSRQMYQALHELEALQKRRSGREAPLARVDVQT